MRKTVKPVDKLASLRRRIAYGKVKIVSAPTKRLDAAPCANKVIKAMLKAFGIKGGCLVTDESRIADFLDHKASNSENDDKLNKLSLLLGTFVVRNDLLHELAEEFPKRYLEKKRRPTTCPSCGSMPVKLVVYGRISRLTGYLMYGGDCHPDDPPRWGCQKCGQLIHKTSRHLGEKK